LVANFALSNHTFAGGSKSLGSVITPSGPHTPASLASSLQAVAGTTSPTLFTDAVVNIDGNKQFIHYSAGGFDFPSSAALVEAARGNLDNLARANAAGVDIAALNITPKAGYQAFYRKSAKSALQPLTSVTNATLNFLYEIVHFSDVRLGFVAFNDTTGNSSSDTFNAPNVSSLYPAGGSANHPLPNISLNQSSDPQNNNYQAITTVIPTLDVWGERNTAQGLKSAIDQLTSHSRQGANKAIILITNGTPTRDLSGATNPTTAAADTLNQAAKAKNLGIPIYCVAVSQDYSEQLHEDNIYSDIIGGIAAVSGNGAKYYHVAYSDPKTTQDNLTKALANVVRQLVSLMK
jgi:hypothetical protein